MKFFTQHANPCQLCPRDCNINRYSNQLGVCGVNSLKIISATLHHGEEPVISGINGSGTIFFSGCSLKCVFCQNYPISQFKYGKKISIKELAKIMLNLEQKGAHNINLVTPTHYSHFIVPAIVIARKKGLSIPIAYNTSGYELPNVIEHLLPYINIFLYDVKYANNKYAKQLSGVNNYVEFNRKSLNIIIKHKKNIISKGIMQEGIIVRHLVIPSYIKNSIEVLDYLAPLKKNFYISLMFQYFPAYKAVNIDGINRKVVSSEYYQIMEHFYKLKFHKGWVQEL